MARASFDDLWINNELALAEAYPNINPKHPYDRSTADAAIASHLAFWTGKNHERIKKLMLESGLVRPKWTKHKGYLEMTITNAVNGCSDVYGSQSGDVVVPTVENPTGIEPVATGGSRFMAATQQVDYFKNCVYIAGMHSALIPNGQIVKPEVFKTLYGGYNFAMDTMNEKTTKNAWEAFTENQAVDFAKVDNVCFRPQLPAYTVVEQEGLKLVNVYVPLDIKRTKGDVSLFIGHMRKLFPIESDYNVFMAYLAAMVQYQGTKFQWCPIVQGTEGNGKSLITRVLEQAIGKKYFHYPNASDLGSGGLKFNGWIQSKIAIAIEEIYTSDRRELTEPLKVLITNDRIEIQFKGGNQYTGDNLANFLMFSNHKDCMKMSYDQRRYWMYFCPQQNKADLAKDGMTEAYFKKIYDWLKEADGYAMVTDFLMSYAIPDELNPATHLQRAPHSSSTDESVKLSMGVVEQHITEAVEEDRQGFMGGYISSKILNTLLTEIRMDGRISPQRRSSILEGLGYVKHPMLTAGRVDNAVAAESAKITIYCKNTMVHDVGLSHSDIKLKYETAQGYAQVPLAQVK